MLWKHEGWKGHRKVKENRDKLNLLIHTCMCVLYILRPCYREKRDGKGGMLSFPSSWFISMNVDILKRLSEVLLTNYSQMASNNVTLIYSYYEFQPLHAGRSVLYLSYLNSDFHKYLQSKHEIRSLRFREVG